MSETAATAPARRYGYVRVSTSRQSLGQQIDALVKAGVAENDIYRDIASGKRDDRAGWRELTDKHLRSGDTLVIVALDRVGRTVTSVLRDLDNLTRRGVLIVSLREKLDMSTPQGRAMAGMFAIMAELEHALILERSQAARDALKARGVQVGPKRKLDDDRAALARQLKASGTMTGKQIAATLGISRPTLYRYLAEGEGAA